MSLFHNSVSKTMQIRAEELQAGDRSLFGSRGSLSPLSSLLSPPPFAHTVLQFGGAVMIATGRVVSRSGHRRFFYTFLFKK